MIGGIGAARRIREKYYVSFDGSDTGGPVGTAREVIQWVRNNNGTNVSYFPDYVGGMVQVIGEKSGKVVYEAKIRKNRYR